MLCNIIQSDAAARQYAIMQQVEFYKARQTAMNGKKFKVGPWRWVHEFKGFAPNAVVSLDDIG